MNDKFRIVTCCLLVSAMLLTAGCGGSDKETYGSDSFAMKSALSTVDLLQSVLPAKNPYDLNGYSNSVSASLRSVIPIVPSAAGKAKVQKASEEFDKDMLPALQSGQYDPAAMSKKLDGIKALLQEVSKEVK